MRHSGDHCVCGVGSEEKENDRWALSMEQSGNFKFCLFISCYYINRIVPIFRKNSGRVGQGRVIPFTKAEKIVA